VYLVARGIATEQVFGIPGVRRIVEATQLATSRDATGAVIGSRDDKRIGVLRNELLDQLKTRLYECE